MGVADAAVTRPERTFCLCGVVSRPGRIRPSFDDPHLVSRLGLVPVLALKPAASTQPKPQRHDIQPVDPNLGPKLYAWPPDLSLFDLVVPVQHWP
jgi:hypothetical protein